MSSTSPMDPKYGSPPSISMCFDFSHSERVSYQIWINHVQYAHRFAGNSFPGAPESRAGVARRRGSPPARSGLAASTAGEEQRQDPARNWPDTGKRIAYHRFTGRNKEKLSSSFIRCFAFFLKTRIEHLKSRPSLKLLDQWVLCLLIR